MSNDWIWNQYVTHTWTWDDATKTFDDSNVVVAGHGAVAAGGSIEGTVTTGNGDAVGNDNAGAPAA